MKTMGLILMVLVFFALTVLIVAWPDLQEYRHANNLDITRTEGPESELDGVRVTADPPFAMIFPTLQDRAVVYVRLGLQGDAATRESWLTCDIALTDARGRRWLPLTIAAAGQLIELVGGREDAGQDCTRSLRDPGQAGGPVWSQQVFLAPVEVLGELRLELSGRVTRPRAISVPIRPVLRPPPA